MSADDPGDTQQDLVLRAVAGDASAFEALMLAHRGRLRALVRRLVGHPEETEDVMQETMIRAWQGLSGFRGESAFGTWLCAIGVRQALDHLRQQKPWRAEAQIVYSNECAKTLALQDEVMAVLSDPAFVYDAREHIAYCFCCVGRSLPPEQQAALILRELMGMTGREAAKALQTSESVLRHRLSSARKHMQASFDGLCSLVSKQGVCYQCKGLREATAQSRRGEAIPAIADFDARCQLAREADIDSGVSQALHDLFWRHTAALEHSGQGSPIPQSDCGQD